MAARLSAPKTSRKIVRRRTPSFKREAGNEVITNLFIDAEWYLNQRIFLIGYAFEYVGTEKIYVHQQYHKNIYDESVIQKFQQCTGYVFVYGPDIGMLEKRFNYPFREEFTCINFLKVVKELVPGLSSYKLADIEKHFGIYREQDKYKKNIFDIYDDWHDPNFRTYVLKYNEEDVYYLARLKQIIFEKYHPSDDWLKEIALKPKEQRLLKRA